MYTDAHSPTTTPPARERDAGAASSSPPSLRDAPPLFVVFNVRSGRGNADDVRRTIAEGCANAGRNFELFEVRHPSKIDELAERAVARARTEGGVVVVAGGDGTINAVAQHAHAHGCAFGVLPQGTFNYFSRTHAIPSETAESLAVLLASQPQAVQVGQVNERLFLVNASLGLYARLLEEREAFKARYGRSRLVALAAACATVLLRGTRKVELRIDCHGEERTLRTPTLFVGNNALQLRQIGMPEARALEQGELAAIALKPIGRIALAWLMLRGAAGRLGAADDVLGFSFDSVSVKPPRGRRRQRIKVATDGEVAWMDMPLQFRVVPRPLWLMKPVANAARDADGARDA